MLSKGLQACKRKGITPNEPAAKKARVNTPSFIAPTDATAAIEVTTTIEATPTTMVDTVVEGSMPPSSMSPPAEDLAPQPPVGRKGGEKKKGKKFVMKVHHRKCLGGSSNNDDNLREDFFGNLVLIQDLTDKFTMLEVVDQMADLDHMQLI
ncbi:hypothetical protein COCNU_scaffold003215G000010 [Cocos nucifera]|nr:hypothetical protein [Cocos nucifera]